MGYKRLSTYRRKKSLQFIRIKGFFGVPRAGIEPAHTHVYRFLRPTRLPIPPPGQIGSAKLIIFVTPQNRMLVLFTTPSSIQISHLIT